MPVEFSADRRRLHGNAVTTVVATHFGITGYATAQSNGDDL